MAPQVSVVLPTRNRSSTLMDALRSALDQEGVELEVIVVDDGSSDGTTERLAQFDDQRLTVARHDTAKGPSAARNAGVERARAEWIAFVDDDDLWAPDYLRKQLSNAETNGLSLSCTGRIEIDRRGDVYSRAYSPSTRDLARRLLSDNEIGGPSGVLLRAQLLERIGNFDERLPRLQDWDLWIRAAASAPAGGCPQPLYAYRHHPGNMPIVAQAVMDSFELMREKHGAAAAEAGIEFGASFLERRVVALDLAQGRRLKAAQGYLRWAVEDRSARDIAGALGALGGDRFRRVGRSLERIRRRPDWLDRYF